jgi:hypothetical protein
VADVVRNVKNLKFDFWGHDMAILHSAKLRRQLEDFQFLNNPVKRGLFIEKLNNVIQNSPFKIISKGVDKRKLKESDSQPANPYELSLEYCIKNVYRFLHEKQQEYRTTHIIIESRGKKEDNDLSIAFQRIVQKNPQFNDLYPLKLILADKKTNSIGLQVADLIAYPIGRFLVNPEQKNLAFKILEEKLYGYPAYIGEVLEIYSGEESARKQKTPDHSRVSAD